MKLSEVTYLSKVKILLFIALVLLYFVYAGAIKKTSNINRQYKQLLQKSEAIIQSNDEIIHLQNKINDIENLIGRNIFLDRSIHELILQSIGKYCYRNNISIREFPAAILYQQGEYIVETHKIVLQGRYIPLLRMVYELEQNTHLAKIVSVNFYTAHNRKKQKDELYVEMYLQNISY